MTQKLTALTVSDIIMEEAMKEKALIINMWVCTIWGIFAALYYSKGAIYMAWWQTLLITIIPSVITAIVTLCISRKSQINNNTNQVNKLIEKMGLKNDRTLSADISDKFDNIIADIGRCENSSLTKQHKDLKHILVKEIEVSERRYKEEEERIKKFSIEQHNTNESIQQFKLFMESWQRMAEKINEQEIRIRELENRLSEEFSNSVEDMQDKEEREL